LSTFQLFEDEVQNMKKSLDMLQVLGRRSVSYKSVSNYWLNELVTKILVRSYSIRKCEDYSYYHCVGDTPLKYETYGELIDVAAEKYGTRDAIVSKYQDKRLTFEEAKKQVFIVRPF
jgi:hypothetical protein